MMSNKVFVALGGNIGDPAGNIQKALKMLSEHVANLEYSSMYLTEPVSSIPQPPYVNAVCSFETSLSPKALLSITQSIEKALGKKAKGKEEPRAIDLDIILYGESCYVDEELTIPHPRWRQRPFVFVPLSELTTTVRIESTITQYIEVEIISITAMVDAWKVSGSPSVTLIS